MADDVLIGKNLATLRTAAGLSQGELAERVGVAQQTIAKIEKGTRPLKVSEAVQICEVLKAPISALTAKAGAVESTAALVAVMHRIDRVESFLNARAENLGSDLVMLANIVAAIRFGRIAEPAAWGKEQVRANAYLETDWSEMFNWCLMRAVRSKCLDLGNLSEIDADTYQEILTRIAETDRSSVSSSDDSDT